jgi:hypothetical protein
MVNKEFSWQKAITGKWFTFHVLISKDSLPTPEMMESAKTLISLGVLQGSIAEDYSLLGHRQVRDTLCPGDMFYENITTWPHWDPLQDVVTVPHQ